MAALRSARRGSLALTAAFFRWSGGQAITRRGRAPRGPGGCAAACRGCAGRPRSSAGRAAASRLMISPISPLALRFGTSSASKPVSSMRGACITVTRRSARPPASARARPSLSADQASSGVSGACDGGEGVDELRRNETADHALAVIRLEAVDARVLFGEALPDREQQAGHDMKPALREFRHGLELRASRGPRMSKRRSFSSGCRRARQRRCSGAPWGGRGAHGVRSCRHRA